MHIGNPYIKTQIKSRRKGKKRYYQTKYGDLSIEDIIGKSGLSRSKVYELLKFKSIDQILETQK